MALKLATTVTVLFTAAVLGAILVWLVFGTLFFDDPNASYSEFLLLLGRPALVVTLVTAFCLLLARRLARSGSRRGAVGIALAPLPIIIGYGLWLGG